VKQAERKRESEWREGGKGREGEVRVDVGVPDQALRTMLLDAIFSPPPEARASRRGGRVAAAGKIGGNVDFARKKSNNKDDG
jgi:hypothetical protein